MARLDDPSGAYLQLGPFRSWWEDPSQPSSTATYTHIAASNGVEACETTSGMFLTWELHWLAMWMHALVRGVPNLVREWSTLDGDLEIEAVEVDGNVHLLVMAGAAWDEGLPPVDEPGRFYHVRLVPEPAAIRRFAVELDAELASFPMPYGDDLDFQVTPESVKNFRKRLSMPFTRHTATSADGTPIAYWESGSGPPLVLVHGAGPNHTVWGGLLPKLAEQFTILALDRRGHPAGDSGPFGDDYAIEREVEDVIAAIDAVGETLVLMGDGVGALAGLEVALRSSRVRRLVMQDPVFGTSRAWLEQMERQAAQFVAGPQLYETRALASYEFAPVRFSALTTPLLIVLRERPIYARGYDGPILGTDSAALEPLLNALPASRLVDLTRDGGDPNGDVRPYVARVISFLKGEDLST